MRISYLLFLVLTVSTKFPRTPYLLSVKSPGIFFEELKPVLNKYKLKIPMYDWDIQAKKILAK